MKKIVNYFHELSNRLFDIYYLQQLSPLSHCYVPWSESALRPSALVTILNEIVINNKNNIVECGGGISTIFIARMLRQIGTGHLFTLEHDNNWKNTIRAMLKNEGLLQYVTIIYAPLVKNNFTLYNNDWYDTSKVELVLLDRNIDLLIVDGPPAYKQELQYARYPAVPFFKQYFTDNFTVVLDDINRKGEKAIIKLWEDDLDITFKLVKNKGNIAIGKSGSCLNIC